MRGGVWILSLVAGVWGEVALFGLGASRWTLVVPVLITSAVLALCARAPRGDAPPEDERRRAGRSVGIWSTVEGVAIFITAIVLINVGAARLIVPAIVVIVGLHFLPLAAPLRLRVYYGLAPVLIALGLGAMLLPAHWPLVAAATGAATASWTTALLIAFVPSSRVSAVAQA